MENNGKQKKYSAVKIFIVIILCIFAIKSIMSGIEKKNFYKDNEENIVSVTATVSKIIETEDSDDDPMHKIYITYTYDGQTYEDVHYFNDGEETDEELGKEHTIEIFANYPDILVKRHNDAGDANFLIGGMALIGMCAVLFSRKRIFGWYIETEGLGYETIKKEIYTDIWHSKKRAVFHMIWGSGFLLSSFTVLDGMFYKFAGIIVGGYLIFGAVANFVKCSKEKKLMDENKFYRSIGRVKKKWQTSKGDDEQYLVEFVRDDNSHLTWKLFENQWYKVQVNEEFTLIYIEGGERPKMLIDSKGEVYRY